MVPFGSVLVVITSAAAWAMVRVSVTEKVFEAASVTLAEMLKVPLSSVVPEIVALGVAEVAVIPEGKPVIVHV